MHAERRRECEVQDAAKRECVQQDRDERERARARRRAKERHAEQAEHAHGLANLNLLLIFVLVPDHVTAVARRVRAAVSDGEGGPASSHALLLLGRRRDLDGRCRLLERSPFAFYEVLSLRDIDRGGAPARCKGAHDDEQAREHKEHRHEVHAACLVSSQCRERYEKAFTRV